MHSAGFETVLLCEVWPAAREVLQPLTGVDLSEIRPYWFANGEVANARATISRTGYSGEDGFEISVSNREAETLARKLLANPAVKPVGLGARDSLRFEPKLALYGHEIDETTRTTNAAK